MLYSNIGVDTVKIKQVLFILLFFPEIQNGDKFIMVDFYGPKGFFVKHIDLDIDLEVKSDCEGRGLSKLKFWVLIKAPPSGQLDSWKVLAS